MKQFVQVIGHQPIDLFRRAVGRQDRIHHDQTVIAGDHLQQPQPADARLVEICIIN